MELQHRKLFIIYTAYCSGGNVLEWRFVKKIIIFFLNQNWQACPVGGQQRKMLSRGVEWSGDLPDIVNTAEVIGRFSKPIVLD